MRALLCILCLSHNDFHNYGLTFRNQWALTAWQFANEGQFHSLHCCFDSSQGVAANQDLVGGEDQSQLLLLPSTLEFGEGELVKRQQQALFRRYFDFDRASVRIARPTFG